MEQKPPAVLGPVESSVRPRAWLCKLMMEDGTTRTQLVDQDPNGLRWNDAGEPSPYSVTPLYEQHELSPEFTDTARAALLWVLWHHQGSSSPVGQPIRFALGLGAHERLSESQIAEAKRWAAMTWATTAEFHNSIHVA